MSPVVSYHHQQQHRARSQAETPIREATVSLASWEGRTHNTSGRKTPKLGMKRPSFPDLLSATSCFVPFLCFISHSYTWLNFSFLWKYLTRCFQGAILACKKVHTQRQGPCLSCSGGLYTAFCKPAVVPRSTHSHGGAGGRGRGKNLLQKFSFFFSFFIFHSFGFSLLLLLFSVGRTHPKIQVYFKKKWKKVHSTMPDT